MRTFNLTLELAKEELVRRKIHYDTARQTECELQEKLLLLRKKREQAGTLVDDTEHLVRALERYIARQNS